MPELIEETDAGAVPAFIPRFDFGPLATLNPFRIRNGDPLQARSLLIRPTIPEDYRWSPIEGLPTEEAVANTDAFIRVSMQQVSATPGLTPPQRRKVAICLGVSRAVTTQMYQVTENDLIPGERVEPRLRQVRTGRGGLVPTARFATSEDLTAPLQLSETETAVVAALATSSYGIVPLQGYSLLMTGHHYLSDAGSQSRRAYQAVERQFWMGQDVREWFSSDADLIRDALWHKSCHPMVMTLKQDMAMDEQVASMLKKAGAGSAAARLPAVESEMRAANSYRTLLIAVRQPYEILGGTVNMERLEDAMTAVRLFPRSGGETAATPVAALPGSIPAWVINREKALEHLELFMARNMDTVAYAFGFYCTMLDATSAFGAEQRSDTLRSSFSLAKLKTQCVAGYNAGVLGFGDYQARKQAARQAGQFETPIAEMK